ncbi:MAG: hypothetical protein HFJ42_08200 [Clostridia bacterium]|nr:hypothetical protein [Clostridia bacterium]
MAIGFRNSNWGRFLMGYLSLLGTQNKDNGIIELCIAICYSIYSNMVEIR